jgi:hypothetical protein
MVVDCYAAESAVTMVAALSDRGYDDYSVEAAIAKVFASEALWRTADEALQTAGGTGFMRELPYERIVRDCRINRIFEGTNDVHAPVHRADRPQRRRQAPARAVRLASAASSTTRSRASASSTTTPAGAPSGPPAAAARAA